MRGKLALGLAGIVCALVASAVPAYAEFQATGPATGPITKFPTKTDLKAGGATISCKSTTATKAEGEWQIWSKFQKETKGEIGGLTKEIAKYNGQNIVTKGPHEGLFIKKWGSCIAETSMGNLPVEVKACVLTIEQTKGTTATGSLSSICVIKVIGVSCIVTVANGEGENEKLTKVTLANRGTEEVEITPEIQNQVKDTVSAGCSIAGVAATKTGTFTATSPLITLGQKIE